MKVKLSDPDIVAVSAWLRDVPNRTSVLDFVPSENIKRLQLKFDIDKLCEALDVACARLGFSENYNDVGFFTMALTCRAGDVGKSHAEIIGNDLSGRYYLRTGYDYGERAREDLVDEAAFSEFVPQLRGTYFEYVYQQLSERFTIGRMRVQKKLIYNCNSWHRDPEPRLHIPILSNPGSLFIVNHHCTHLPADGSVYFTDTRGYHTALNGGESERVHIVVTLLG